MSRGLPSFLLEYYEHALVLTSSPKGLFRFATRIVCFGNFSYSRDFLIYVCYSCHSDVKSDNKATRLEACEDEYLGGFASLNAGII